MDVLEDRIPGLEDVVAELNHPPRENDQLKEEIHEQNMQELWENMERPNLQIMIIEEGK